MFYFPETYQTKNIFSEVRVLKKTANFTGELPQN